MKTTIQSELLKSMYLHRSNIAIEQGDTTVSYQTLLDKANLITYFLLEKNLEKETLVGIFLENRIDIIISIIGIMNARCVFVPLDPSLPESRISLICEELNVQHVITSNQNPNQTFLHNVVDNCYPINEIFARNVIFGTIDYNSFDEKDSIYIYFTSGSTGKPKGILGVNRSLIHFVQWEINEFGITDKCRCSQLISPYFDAFLRDIFVPLLVGGTVCITPSDEYFFTSEKMTLWLDDTRITMIHCVPSVFNIINYPEISNKNFPSLLYILLSGEKIVPSNLINWYNTFGSRIQLVNLYGATETTMIKSFYRIQPKDVNQARIPIGQPISDTELVILKEDYKPCGTLVPGELFIISDYITKGYYNQPDLNEEKFVKILLADKRKVVAYKTGDKARMLANGFIDLIGRDDRQIKLNGIRIELDEVEQLLAKCNTVNSVVVIVQEEQNAQMLVAFVIPNKIGEVGVAMSVFDYAKQHLPTYMLPSKVVVVESFPLLSNGKLDYKELLNFTIPEELKAPSTDNEDKLMKIWQEILGNKPMSVTSTFHSQGGNSLGIMKLIARLYKEFHVRIQLSDLFNNLTIEKQGILIQTALQDNIMSIPVAPVKIAYHLSAAQEAIYYNYGLNKQQTIFNLPVAWELKGNYDFNKLTTAFQQLLERHEILRTTFKIENGKLLQVIADKVKIAIEEIISLETDGAKAILDFIRPFDLSQSPLIRCGLIALPSDRRILVMDIHHIICDGISQTNIYADFLKLYNREKLNPLPVQYKDYAEWEYNFRLTDNYLSLREFWLKEFEDGVPELNILAHSQKENISVGNGKNLHFKIDKSTYKSFVDNLVKENITLFSGLFGIFYIFLSQLSGDDDIVIGINTSGRMQQELDNLVGMFAKTLPVRNKIDLEKSYRQFIHQVHQKLLETTSRQLYDLSDIVSDLRKNKLTLANGLFQVMLVFQNFSPEVVATQEIEFTHHEFENPTSKYLFTLFVTEGSDALHFRFEYATDYFAVRDMEIMREQFVNLFSFASNNFDDRIVDYGSIPTHSFIADDEDIDFNF